MDCQDCSNCGIELHPDEECWDEEGLFCERCLDTIVDKRAQEDTNA